MAGQRNPGTFRGVPFFVEAHEAGFGRRSALHEYPLRDVPYVEDLGRKARQLTIEALVLGPDYTTARDRLLGAVEQPGPGKLVHPYLGELQVSITEVKLRESTAEGGMARFTLTCVESGLVTFPAATTSSADEVDTAGTRLEEAAKATFERRYAVSEKPDYVAGDARSVIGLAMAQIAVSMRSSGAGAEEVAATNASVQGVTNGLVTLVYDPAAAAQALMGNVRALLGAATEAAPRNAFSLARPFFGFGSGLLPVPLADPDAGPVTASRLQQATNREQMTGAVRMAAVADACRAASEMTFSSYDEAVAVRTELADAIDMLAESKVSDEVYGALMGLRASMVRDITSRGADLARVVRYTPQVTVPALVLAHQLYGDASRDAEIVARNSVRHPGFLQGNQALEVLSDA